MTARLLILSVAPKAFDFATFLGGGGSGFPVFPSFSFRVITYALDIPCALCNLHPESPKNIWERQSYDSKLPGPQLDVQSGAHWIMVMPSWGDLILHNPV